jgi:hypothetical protein
VHFRNDFWHLERHARTETDEQIGKSSGGMADSYILN